MKQIKEYCDKRQTFLMWSTAFIYLLLFVISDKYIAEMLPYNDFRTPLSILFDLIGPSFIAGLIYATGLKYVRNTLWKKKYPQWDIGGKWEDDTTYYGYFDKDGQKPNDSSPIPSDLNIEQTYDSIRILPSDSINKESNTESKNFTWRSICATLTADNGEQSGTLHILYRVDYDKKMQEDGYPQFRYGYEEVTISLENYSSNTSKKPTVMRGKFAHCVNLDGNRSYYGEVYYKRREETV